MEQFQCFGTLLVLLLLTKPVPGFGFDRFRPFSAPAYRLEKGGGLFGRGIVLHLRPLLQQGLKASFEQFGVFTAGLLGCAVYQVVDTLTDLPGLLLAFPYLL